MSDQPLILVTHELIIDRLRPRVDARCSCGEWNLAGAVDSAATDAVLTARVNTIWRRHAGTRDTQTLEVRQAFARLIGDRVFLRDLDLSMCDPATIRALLSAVQMAESEVQNRARSLARKNIGMGRL